MNKRIFKILLVVMAVVLFAATLFTACEKRSEVYYLSKSSEFTAYEKEEDVPQNVRFVKGGGNGEYTLTADFEQGEQFVVYNVGQSGNVVTDIFSSEQHLSLKDGKITVADKGTYALTLNTASGELSYAYTAPQTAPTVTKVEITTKTETLKVGENFTFAATVTMSDNTTNGNVTWASSQPTVATIGADGKVEALAAGTTVISATAGDQKAEITLTVESGEPTPVQPTVTKVEITTKTETLKVGENFTFAATVTMSDNTTNGNVTWASSQPTVATIGADGKVEALAAGTTVISATAGEQKAEITLTVESGEPTPVQPTVTKVEITTKTETLKVGKNFTFAATVTMSDNTTNGNVTWASSQLTVATIGADGKVEALAAGTTVISATAGDQKAEITLTVEDEEPGIVHVQSISLSSGTLSLEEGKEALITVTILPADATDKGYSIALQGDIEAVEMTATGDGCRLTGRHVGTVTLVVVSSDNSAAIARCTITVTESTDIPAEEIQLSESELYFYDGGEAQTLTVTVKPDGATDKEYTYELSEEGIVTVEAVEGGYKITPTSVGEVTLTVKSHYDEQITAECSIYVDPTAVTDLQIDPTTIGKEEKFFPGDTQDITVTVLPANATNSDYTYELDQEEIVSVEEISGGYKITALAEGTVKLTVKSSDKEEITAQCEITVSKLEVTSIEMASTLTLEKGNSHQLTYTLKPDGVEDTITYSIGAGEDSIISVDIDGTIHALAEGIAHVTAHATNGVTAECEVTVPKHVTGMTLSSALTVYVGDGAKSRDLAVGFIPTDATFTDFTVDVQQDGEIIEWEKGDGKITITGKTAGTATVTVTSVDNEEATKSCTVTVKDISEAVPYFSPSSVVVLLGDTSEEVEILSDYGVITDFTTTSNSLVTINKVETDDGSFKFTVTGLKFGKATITFKVTIGETTHQLYFAARIVSDYFYLTGIVGGNEAWVTQESEAAAREANLLLEQKDADTWEITRDFKAGDKIQILPSILGESWANALTNTSYYAVSGEANNGIVTQDVNVMFSHDGNYTVKLLLSINAYMTAHWQVITNYIAPTSATISGDVTQLEQNDEVTTANLTLNITPTLAVDKIEADDVVWTVDQSYASWLTLTKGENGRTCAVELVDFQGEETVHATITATITKGNFVVTATFDLALMPEGAGVVYVNDITFDQESYELLVDSAGWTITVHADVNKDATTQGVTYSIVSGQSELYNGVSNDKSFTIDAATGKITAKQFGTIKVRATSVGENESGRSVTKDVEVKIYSKTLKLVGVYGDKKDSKWENNATAYTSATSDTEYVWKDLTLYNQDQIVVMYNTGDWNNGVIRNYNTYRATDSTSGVVASSGSSIDNWCFLIQKDGVYTITVKLSGTKPTVKFEKTADLEVSDTWSAKITDVAIVSTGNTWGTSVEYFARKQNQTVTNENPYVELLLDCTQHTTLNTTNPQIGFIVGSTWYNSQSAKPKFTNSSKYVAAWSTGKWEQYNGQLQYVGNPYTDGVKLNFKFQFDSHGTLVDIQVSAAE